MVSETEWAICGSSLLDSCCGFEVLKHLHVKGTGLHHMSSYKNSAPPPPGEVTPIHPRDIKKKNKRRVFPNAIQPLAPGVSVQHLGVMHCFQEIPSIKRAMSVCLVPYKNNTDRYSQMFPPTTIRVCICLAFGFWYRLNCKHFKNACISCMYSLCISIMKHSNT